jgi:hypothetical protein
MNNPKRYERGQAIILIAFGIIGLVAVTALAIDSGYAFADRRHAQSAADTAAFAAALEKIQDTPNNDNDGINWSAAGFSRASSNGYTNDGVASVVTVVNPPGLDCKGNYGPYAGNDEYYQVLIRSTVDTWFGSVVGITQLHNCVEAIARVKPSQETPLALGAAIAAMKCSDKDTVKSIGSSTVTLIGGGAFSNSNDPEALLVKKLTNLVTPVNKGLMAVGGVSAPYGYPSPITTGIPQFPCPLPDYMLPKYTCDYSYGDFPPNVSDSNVTITGSGSSRFATFSPGVYCISGGFAKTGMYGDGVTFVMLNEGISWEGNANISLYAPKDESAQTKGLLIYLPYANSHDIVLNGTAGLDIYGSVFAPGSLIRLTGDFANQAIHSQWVGSVVDLSGSLNATIEYSAEDNWNFLSPPEIQLTR